MHKPTRRLNDQDRKWAFVGAMSRSDLEKVVAAVIEQLCMTEGAFTQDAQWSGADVCDELSRVLAAVGATYGNLRVAKPVRPTAPKGPTAAAMREALEAFVSTVDNTGGIKPDPEGPVFDVLVADSEWVDMAEAYKLACEALDRKPKRLDTETEEVV